MKMKKITKLLAFIIIASVLLISFSACNNGSGSNNPAENTTRNGDSAGNSAENNQTETDANLRENTPDSLPDNLNFNGTEVRVFHRANESETDGYVEEIAVESEIGEIVNDALYMRNQKVEDRLNIKIVSVSQPGGWTNRDNFLSTIRKSVGAGTSDFDYIAGYAYYITSLAPEGLLYNLRDVEYLNPEAVWWSASLADQLTIDNKLYYITGDYAITFLKTMFVMYYNKTLAQDIGLPNLYQIVLDGGFTVDKMSELMKGAYQDINGNSKPDEADRYGFALTTGNFVDAMFNTFDLPIVRKDTDGVPQLALNSQRMVGAVEKIYSLLYESGNTFAIDEKVSGSGDLVKNMFIENRTLFLPGTMGTSDGFRAMNSDYGIIPYPKLDDSQPNYYTTSQDSYSLFCVPVTCDKTDVVGATMEAMCAESYRTVTPAYYEIALKKKYTRDDESSQMLDLIRSGATFDFGTVNSINMDNINKIFRDLMTEKKTDFVSRYDKSESKWQKDLDKLVAAYNNLP